MEYAKLEVEAQFEQRDAFVMSVDRPATQDLTFRERIVYTTMQREEREAFVLSVDHPWTLGLTCEERRPWAEDPGEYQTASLDYPAIREVAFDERITFSRSPFVCSTRLFE
jgi:hypothetical protein